MQLAFDLIAPPGGREINLPPVIMLHGMLDSRKTWKRIASAISQNTGRKVYIVDARNHGDSPWSDDMTFDILADDLAEFMRQRSIPKATLIGHSMGGRTAMILAMKKPDMVEKFISEDMGLQKIGPFDEGIFAQFFDILNSFLHDIPLHADEETAFVTIVNAVVIFIKEIGLISDDQIQFYTKRLEVGSLPIKRVGATYHWKTNLNVVKRFVASAISEQTFSGTYKGGALFLHGTSSIVDVMNDQLIYEYFPGAIKIPFEGATHLVHVEQPERFIKEASNFINTHEKIVSKL